MAKSPINTNSPTKAKSDRRMGDKPLQPTDDELARALEDLMRKGSGILKVGIAAPSELTFNEERFIADTMLDFLLDTEPPVTEFWSGCAYGGDTIGIRAAIRALVPVIGLTIPTGAWHNEPLVRELLKAQATGEAPYELLVKRTKEYPHANDAYMPRNDLTVASIDVLCAFPPNSRMPDRVRGGRGAGTWATVRRAMKKKRKIYHFPLDGSSPFLWWPEQGQFALEGLA